MIGKLTMENFLEKENKVKEEQEAFLKGRIQDIAHHHPYYGYHRVTAQLHRENIRVNHKRVLGLMRKRYLLPNNRRICPWQNFKTKLTIAALEMAIADRNTDNLIHHFDQGVQYTSADHTNLLKEHGI